MAYPTHGHLHDGVEAALRGVQVPRDLLLPHQSVERGAFVSQRQHVLVAERAGAVLVACAWIQQLGRSGADVRHDCLLHKGAKSFEEKKKITVKLQVK